MDEVEQAELVPVGEQLRAAREGKGLSLEDVASQTRIPRRHLESLEAGQWDNLPAPTYTMGFAKSYASAVGLDRTAIGDQLRVAMGGLRAASSTAEVFEPADPARSMPKWLVLGAVGAVLVLALLLSWLNRRSLEAPETPVAEQPVTEAQANLPAAAPAAVPAARAPVVLTATEPVWIQVYETGGRSYFSGILSPGQPYTVPATAAAPLLKTGKPEALRVTVGSTAAPPVGPVATTISDVSLLPQDLLKAGQAPAARPPAPAPAPARVRPTRRTTRPSSTAPPAEPAAPAPAPVPANSDGQ